MKAFPQRLYAFSCKFIQLCSLFLTSLLLVGAFLSTCYSEDMETQLVLTRWDNPFFGAMGIAAFLLALMGFIRFLTGRMASPVKVLRIAVLLWCVAIGGILIVFSKTVPAADALSVYSIAGSLAAGDTSVIHPTDSYLSYYPQQVGLVAFFELLTRIWNLFPFQVPAYHFIKCIYVVLLCVIICFQERKRESGLRLSAASRRQSALPDVQFLCLRRNPIFRRILRRLLFPAEIACSP